ncbi:cache domain-containing protein [Nostoc sp. UHCC 0302]|uniref:cache domain-containing protein n=1 Tax=Nostoc sp. UHCC 0302 TaxID=3134896 RepID=UPI00311CA684
MKKHTKQKIVFFALLSFCGITLALALFGFYTYWHTAQQRLQKAKNQAQREAVLTTLEIENELRNTQDNSLALANSLTTGEINDEQLSAQLQQKIEKNPYLATFGVAYEAGVSRSKSSKLDPPVYLRVNNSVQLGQQEKNDDNTKYPWYRKTLQDGASWGEPYRRSQQSLLTEPIVGFYAPFYRLQGKEKLPQGVLFSEYSLSQIQQLIDSLQLELGKTGYAFVLSKDGTFVYHTITDNVKQQNNLVEIAAKQNNKQLQALVQKALQGKESEAELFDETTGQNSWFFLQPTKLNGWVVGVVFLEQEVLLDDQTKRQTLILSCLALVWFFICLSILMLRAYEFRTSRVWIVSSISSILFAANIGMIWKLALGDRNYITNHNVLLNQAQVDKLLAPQVKLNKNLNRKPPLYVPTGIFIQSLEFESAKKVFMTGYIWQKYTKGIHDGLTRGFIMPDAVSANDVEIKEAYHYNQGNVEVIGWYVEATILQNLDYSHYPFDYKDIQIRLWHSDFNTQSHLNRQVFLTPDFESYKIINPSAHPGLDKRLVLDGWQIEDSFFEYLYATYDSNFGIPNTIFKTNVPELNFNITTKRQVISIFISRIGPLFVVVVMLFAMLVIADRDKAMEVLAACAGFIFIVILDQISLREQVLAKGLVYFEFFYLVIYLYIFVITINAVLMLVKPELKVLQYQDNLIAKIFYWPSLLKLLLLITIFIFF